jgi:hypothetical protein
MFEMTNNQIIIGQWGDTAYGEDDTIEVVNPRVLLQMQDPNRPGTIALQMVPHILGERVRLMLSAIVAFSSQGLNPDIVKTYQEMVTGLILPRSEFAKAPNGNGTVVRFGK